LSPQLEYKSDAAMTDRSTIDPKAIREVSLPKSLRGFDEAATRKLLSEVATVVESLTAEREKLRRQVESLQTTAPPDEPITAASAEDAENPEALGNLLLAAKHAGEELVAAAQEEARRILATATAEADRLAERARADTEDIGRELDEQRAQLQVERENHDRAVNEWATKVEAEKEAAIAQARAEAEAVLAASQQELVDLQRQEEELNRLISEKQTQFVRMLQSALAQLEPLAEADKVEEPGNGDLPGALKSRVGSGTPREVHEQTADEQLSS
jgi:cell division septum initiation protein DivIVA